MVLLQAMPDYDLICLVFNWEVHVSQSEVTKKSTIQ